MGRRNQAQQRLQEAAAEWRQRAQRWGSEHPESIVDDPVPEPPAAERLLADRSAARAAQERARQWARPRLHEARQRISAVEQELGEVRAQVRTGEQELTELRSGVERTPARPDWATAERTEQDGRAFYRLVDFQPSLDDAQRAGLEAALQASGLLNAWVSAQGTVAGFEDVLAAPGEAGSAGTLAELLVPAPEPGCPVPAEHVAALLASVSTVCLLYTSDAADE